MQKNENPFANMPRHHYLFMCVRDGGGVEKTAHALTLLHEISMEDLKAQCRKAGEEHIAATGGIQEPELRVYNWACS